MPERIQRKRTKGWRMPKNTVYVGRGSKWGNPFRIGVDGNASDCCDKYQMYIFSAFGIEDFLALQEELGGKNLACWCPLNSPCHADLLLKLANWKFCPFGEDESRIDFVDFKRDFKIFCEQ